MPLLLMALLFNFYFIIYYIIKNYTIIGIDEEKINTI